MAPSCTFAEGFKTLGLLDQLQRYPYIFHEMFLCEEKPRQAKDLNSLFTVDFSRLGSNRRSQENRTICFWRAWLIDNPTCQIITLYLVSNRRVSWPYHSWDCLGIYLRSLSTWISSSATNKVSSWGQQILPRSKYLSSGTPPVDSLFL